MSETETTVQAPRKKWGVKLDGLWLRDEEGHIARFTEDEAITKAGGYTAVRAEPTVLRGFASIDPQRMKEIGRKGGLAVQAAGKGHRFSHEKAQEAGRLGGRAVHAKRVAAKATGG